MNPFHNLDTILAADLLNMQSPANRHGYGNVRRGATPELLGKYAGKIAIRDAGSGDHRIVIATGPKPSDRWFCVDGSASYVPLNMGAFTPAAGCSYSNGLLTADGVDNPTATQTITALAAGTYYISGVAAAEGPLPTDLRKPRLIVSGATDGTLLTKYYSAARHATAAESATNKEIFGDSFTLTVAQNVTIGISVVDEDNALASGSAYILFNPLEAQ